MKRRCFSWTYEGTIDKSNVEINGNGRDLQYGTRSLLHTRNINKTLNQD